MNIIISSLDRNPNPFSIASVYTFSVIALFILRIACINFVNLTTVRFTKRAGEVGQASG